MLGVVLIINYLRVGEEQGAFILRFGHEYSLNSFSEGWFLIFVLLLPGNFFWCLPPFYGIVRVGTVIKML